MQTLWRIIGIAAAPAAWATPISGTVLDETGAPIPGAQLEAFPHGVTATTDASGAFTLDLPDGPATLQVLHEVGSTWADLDVAPGFAPLTLTLFAAEDYVVEVFYYDEDEPVVTRRRVDNEVVQRVPGAFGDPVRVVNSLPGAARPAFGSSELVIRGGDSDDTSVMVDGVEIPIVYHLGGFRSVIHPSNVATVDFLPGVTPSRYGDATGGVIDIGTRADFDDAWEAGAQVDLLDASAYTRGSIADTVGVSASLRRSYIDGILAAASQTTALPRWFDYQLQLQTLSDGPHQFRLFVLGLDDSLTTDSDLIDLSTRYRSHRVVGSYTYEPNHDVRFLVQPMIGWDSTSNQLGTTLSVDQEGWRTGLRAEGRWRASSFATLTGGVDIKASHLDITAELPFDPTDIEGGAAVSTAEASWLVRPDPFVEAQLRPIGNDDFVVVAGLRLETMWREGFAPDTGLSPRLSARYSPVPGTTFKAGGGIFYQSPNEGAQAFSRDSALDLERANTVEGGVEQRFGRVAKLDVTTYYKGLDHLATQAQSRLGFTNTGIGRAYGLEVLLEAQDTGPFFGWVSYSLSRADRIDDPEVDDTWIRYASDQTHNLVALAGYDLGRGWDVSMRFQTTSGTPYTAYDGAVFDLDDGTYTGIPSSDTNGERLPAYLSWDVRVAKAWDFQAGTIKAYVDVLGLVQGENPEAVIDAYDFSETAFLNGLPTLPAVGLQADLRF